MIPNFIAAVTWFATGAAESTEGINLLSLEGLIVITNMVLAIVTVAAVVVSIKELRGRAKDSDESSQLSQERLATIVHTVLENEHEEDMTRLDQSKPKEADPSQGKKDPGPNV